MDCNCKKIDKSKLKLCPLPPIQCIQNFPFLDATFDSVTNLQIMESLGQKTNEIIAFINNILEDKIVEYIDKRFNDIMLNAMYDAETETLVLFLDNKEKN